MTLPGRGTYPAPARGTDGAEAEQRAPSLVAGFTSLSFIGRVVRRRARYWCAAGLVGLVIGAAAFVLRPPPYQATTSLILMQNPTEDAGNQMLTDVTLAQGRAVAVAAMRMLGLPRTPQSTSSFTSAYTPTAITYEVMLITVNAPSESEAVSRAKALATAFLRYRARILQTEQRLAIETYDQRVGLYQQQMRSLTAQIDLAKHEPTTPKQQATLNHLDKNLSDVRNALALAQDLVRNYPVITTSMIIGSRVLDPSAAVPRSHFRVPAMYVGGGLLAGLAVGLGIVIVQAMVSVRLRRRDDIAYALDAPVGLSVGPIRSRHWLPARYQLRAAGPAARRIAGYLRHAVPAGRRPAALAVVAVDSAHAAALSMVSLAISRAHDGSRVVVADLAPGHPAAQLLGTGKPGVHNVRADGAELVLVVPDRGDLLPAGPLTSLPGRAAAGQPASDLSATSGLTSACNTADLLLTLITLDPALGADHLPTWATDAVVIITAGQSSATKIHAAGEMIRIAGTRLAAAILIGADKTDESLGLTPAHRSGLALTSRVASL